MRRSNALAVTFLAAALVATCAGRLLADGASESSGVNRLNGDASPAAGFSAGEQNSRIDDYIYQDEQININGHQDAVVKVLRVNQKNLINDYVVAVFPVRNAPALELRNLFRNVAGAEGGRAEVISDKVKGEYFLWVVAPRFQMPYIEAAIKALDEPWVKDDFDGSAEAYYKAKFRNIANINTIVQVPVAAAVRGSGGDNTVDVDTVNNAVLFSGEPYRAESYAKYAAQVDKPVPRILLEATVYEVEVSNMKRIGLDYIAWKNGPGRNLFEFIFFGAAYTHRAHNITSIFDPFVPAWDDVDGTVHYNGHTNGWFMAANYLVAAAYLDFLEGSGRARVVTSGKLVVNNGQTASLTATDQVIYFRSSPNESDTPSTGTVPSSVPIGEETGALVWANAAVHNRTIVKDSKVTVGFSMDITPYIAQETTQLGIALEMGNIVGQTPSGLPQVRTHEMTTTVLVRDGQPICVGGIRRDEDVKGTQKIPVLGSIPILGWLFGQEATGRAQTEMVIVLTPTVRFGSEADLEMAKEEDKTLRAQVERRARLQIPETEFGFDQWLIGSDS